MSLLSCSTLDARCASPPALLVRSRHSTDSFAAVSTAAHAAIMSVRSAPVSCARDCATPVRMRGAAASSLLTTSLAAFGCVPVALLPLDPASSVFDVVFLQANSATDSTRLWRNSDDKDIRWAPRERCGRCELRRQIAPRCDVDGVLGDRMCGCSVDREREICCAGDREVTRLPRRRLRRGKIDDDLAGR